MIAYVCKHYFYLFNQFILGCLLSLQGGVVAQAYVVIEGSTLSHKKQVTPKSTQPPIH
jgi:hypothetical protein